MAEPRYIITAQRLHQFAPKCDAETWAPVLRAACVERKITTPLRIANFLGQLSHESAGLTRFQENLSYSARRLCEVWPKRFPSLELAAPFANNPEALANRCYGGRLGNVNAGDGWLFRGRGPLQLTGRDNYRLYGEILGLPLEENPDLALKPAIGARIAAAFWDRRKLNSLADLDDVTGITVAINGGSNGLVDRRLQVERAKGIFR